MAQKPGVQMTSQRRKLLREVANGATVSEAGRRAKYSTAQAAHFAWKRLRVEAIRALERQGMPVENLVKKLIAKAEAKEMKFYPHNGVVIDTREVEAHAVQLDAAD